MHTIHGAGHLSVFSHRQESGAAVRAFFLGAEKMPPSEIAEMALAQARS